MFFERANGKFRLNGKCQIKGKTMKLQDVIEKRNRFHRGVVRLRGGTNETMSVGVWVMTGRRPGPTLYIQAAQHTEYQGTGAIRDLAEKVKPEMLRGTLILVPLVCTRITEFHDKRFDEDGPTINVKILKEVNAFGTDRDLYRQWPGNPEGVAEQRMVHLLWENFVKYADAFVDIHSWSMYSVPTLLVYGKSKRSLELALSTGYPYINVLRPASHGPLKDTYDIRSNEMNIKVPRLGVPGFVIEATHVSGQGGWLIKENMRLVERALLNLMKKMGMLSGKGDYSAPSVLYDMNETHVKAKKKGFFIPEAPLGTLFKKGAVVGRVYDIKTFELIETLKAPCAACFHAIWPVAVVTPKNYAVMLKDNFKIIRHKD